MLRKYEKISKGLTKEVSFSDIETVHVSPDFCKSVSFASSVEIFIIPARELTKTEEHLNLQYMFKKLWSDDIHVELRKNKSKIPQEINQ
jgi:hypothetical protein